MLTGCGIMAVMDIVNILIITTLTLLTTAQVITGYNIVLTE